ncbi:hypothetical protein V8B97DRAFT_885283 [Scleroderma yunnanense]
MDMPSISEQPDFLVKSILDQFEFPVQRCVLERSEVFKDMFALCDQGPNSDGDKLGHYVELNEPAETLRTLLELLSHPPPPPLLLSSPAYDSAHECWIKSPFSQRYDHDSVIPFPILPGMIQLADKYCLSEPLIRSLRTHLFANAFLHPLKVYGFATANGFDDIAVEASAYLLHPPLAVYTREEISIIPTVVAYHDLVRLHAHRIDSLRTILLSEDIFPFGYGACDAHRDDTARAWNERRIQLAPKIEAASDLASEMRALLGRFLSCQTCSKACIAATEMLEYKCRRVARTIRHLSRGKRAS